MSDATQLCPGPADLDLLELVRIGAVRPTAQQPVCLRLAPSDLLPEDAHVELVDPEGVPLTTLPVEAIDGGIRISLTTVPEWSGQLSTRPFETRYRPPDEVRAAAESGIPVMVVDGFITEADLPADPEGSPVILLVLAGPSTAPSARTLALLRHLCDVATSRPGTLVVAVPLAADCTRERPDLAAVLSSYAPRGWVTLKSESASAKTASPSGVVLLFTGLSGSGKSTVARGVRNAILERYERPVTLLDGDIVRRSLSAELGFSPQDRETNVRRIGWVAAQIAHHGGIAICSPIAPYASTRHYVRRTVIENGGQFVLIHISTPLSICEERDRKGLYAKARAGLLREFTGVSAPYEQPTDADLVLDTSTMTIDEATERVQRLLTSSGALRPPEIVH